MSLATLAQQKRILLVLELLFLIIGTLYIYYTPLWTPADEERHFACCEFIAQHKTLPIFKPQFEENEVYMAFHPPLYYVLGSLLCADDEMFLEEHLVVNELPGIITLKEAPHAGAALQGKKKSAYLLRGFSLLCGAVTVFFVYNCALVLFPGMTWLAVLIALFVGMNPEFIHVSASISNDNLNTALATACLFSLLYLLKNPFSIQRAGICGILAGCAIMTKTPSLVLVPVLCLSSFYIVYTYGVRRTLMPLGVLFFLLLMFGGWWYVRNWLLFDDPLFTKTMATAHPWAPRYAPLMLADIATIIHRTLISFFGHFGGSKLALPYSYLLFYWSILFLGCIGLVKGILSRKLFETHGVVLVIVGMTALGGLCFFILFNIKYVGAYEGRYLFAFICPLALIVGAGINILIPQHFKKAVSQVIAAGLVCVNLCAVLFVVRPGYAAPRLVVDTQQDFFDVPTLDINIHRSIGQSFFATRDNLCGIQVVFSHMPRKTHGTLFFTLQQGGHDGQVITTIPLPVQNIEDFAIYYFVFPPLRNSAGKQYYFAISTHDMFPESGISLWQASRDVYQDGRMYLGDNPGMGDLYFFTYSFTGDKPTSIWEGTKPAALANGIYFDIWELQFYLEQSKPFRATTSTHKKFLQFQAALKRRERSK